MNKAINFLLLFLTAAFLLSAPAHAYVQGNGFLCVNDTADLGADFQAALDEISSNNRPDSNLRLIQDTYSIADNATGHFNIETNHSLTISGGWNANCSTPTADPQLTVLQGGATQDYQGGVLSVIISDNSKPATVTITNMTVQNGSSQFDGGGLYVEHNLDGTLNVNITDVIIELNSSEIYGSGIAVFEYGTEGMTVNISDCIVQNNTVPAGSLGGPAGIYIDKPEFSDVSVDVNVARCQILNNLAERDGGGIFIDSGSGNSTLVNNVIASNSVSDDNGGGIYIINTYGGDTTLTNNTITDNETTGAAVNFQGGGGLYVELNNNSSKLDVYNNIIYNNSAVGDGGDIFILNPTDNEVNIKHNDFNFIEPGGFYVENKFLLSQENNLNNVNPLFENPVTGDYHLTSLSPVIAMGDNAAPAVPSDDLDGLPRPVNGTVDMGAYEYQNPVSTTTTTTLPGGTTTTTLPATTTTTLPAATTSTTTTSTTSTTFPGSTTTTTVPSTGGGGGGGGGIFGDIIKSSVIGYHLDGYTKEGVHVYMPVTLGFKALKGAQEYVRSFAPNLARTVRECFDFLEKQADANNEGLLYSIGTHAFPLLGNIAEKSLTFIGAEKFIDEAYLNTTISIEEFNELQKKGLAIAPKIVKETENPKLERILADLVN